MLCSLTFHLSDQNLSNKSAEEDGHVFFCGFSRICLWSLETEGKGLLWYEGRKVMIESHSRAKLITSWRLGSKERHQVKHLGCETVAWKNCILQYAFLSILLGSPISPFNSKSIRGLNHCLGLRIIMGTVLFIDESSRVYSHWNLQLLNNPQTLAKAEMYHSRFFSV